MAKRADMGVSSALRSVARGAGAKFVGLGAVRILGFITTFLLTHTLGANLYGIYSFGKTLISIASTVTNLGTNQSIIRFIPQYDNHATQNRVLGLATLTSFVASLVVGTILYFSAPLLTKLTLNQPMLTDALRLLSITLTFSTLTGCVSSAFQSLDLPGYSVIAGGIGFQVFRLITIGAAVLVGAAFVGIVAAAVVATILAFVLAVGLLFARTDLRPSLKTSQPDLQKFYNFSVPLTLSDVGMLFQNKVDILMIGIFLPGSAVGIYNLSSVLSQVLTIPLTGLNTMFPPIASRMYSNDEHANLDALFTQVTRWSFTLSLLPSLGLLVYSTEILTVFGNGFSTGTWVLSLFVIAQLANAATGPSSYTLMMTDHQYLVMIDRWGIGISNAVLNYFLITHVGLIGAAVATAIVSVVVGFLRVVELWYTERLFPYSLDFFKPLAAGLASGAVMLGWKLLSLLPGIASLVVGGISGTVVFVLVLVAIGIEPQDREFFADIVSRWE